MDLGLVGKSALVTGGSQGIGLATARLLAAEGAAVTIAARRADALEAAAAAIAADTGRRPATLVCDVTRPIDLDAAAEAMRARDGGCDILVNNAGTGTYKPFLEVTDADLVEAMAINFFAQFRLCQRIVPMMVAAGGGAIVNVAGRTAYQTLYPPGSTCSGPAKAAELRFTADLAQELKGHGIRVNCVVPGVVLTPERLAKWEREATGAVFDDPASRDRLVARATASGDSQGGRWGTAEEVADLIVYLASPRSSYVSGESILIDGSTKQSYRRVLAEQAGAAP